MLKQLFLCLIVISAIGCSKDFEFEKNKDLPLSHVVYSEDYDGTVLTYDYTESNNIIFRDEREHREECGLFIIRTIIENEEDNITIAFGFFSHIDSNQIENNEQFLNDDSALHEIIHRDPIFYKDDDLCTLPENETSILSVSTAAPVGSIVATTISDDLVITKFERETFRNDGLGYIMLDIELSYTAIQFDFPSINDISYIPANLKLKHAIRFPEFDKK